MKKRFSMFITLLISVAMIVTALPVDAFAGEISLDDEEEIILTEEEEFPSLESDEPWKDTEGTCGENATFYMEEDPEHVYPTSFDLYMHKLYISGSGALDATMDYQSLWWYWQYFSYISIGDEITSIGDLAFANLAIYGPVIIGSGVETIGDSAFASSRLPEVEIPKNVISIGDSAFATCVDFNKVTFEQGSKCTTIGVGAFNNDSGLTSIKIPATVTTIGASAFSGTGLTSIEFESSTPPTMGGEAFDGLPASGGNIYVKGNVSDWITPLTNAGLSDVSTEDGHTWKIQSSEHQDNWVVLPGDSENEAKAYCTANAGDPTRRCEYYWDGQSEGFEDFAIVSITADDVYLEELEGAYTPVFTDTAGVATGLNLVYKKADGTLLESAPSVAGDYSVSLTFGTGNDAVTISDTFSIKDAIAHGDCSAEGEGNDVKWEIVKGEDFTEDNEVYTLHLFGKGFMDDYYPDGKNPLWLSVKDDKDNLIYDKITKASLSGSIHNIGEYGLYNMTGLKEIDFEDNEDLRIIKWNAFANDGIETITIPASVSTLQEDCLACCSNLKSITFERINPDDLSIDGPLVIDDSENGSNIKQLPFTTFNVPAACSDAQLETYRTNLITPYTYREIPDANIPEIVISQEPVEGKWNIARYGHMHTWNYLIDENKPNQIKAYCSNADDACDYYWDGETDGFEDYAVYEINAEDAYSGDLSPDNPYEPISTYPVVPGVEITITYEKSDGTPVEGTPFLPGDYTVTLKIGEDEDAPTISDTFTIKNAVAHGDCSAPNGEGEDNDVKWEIAEGENFDIDTNRKYTLHLFGKGKMADYDHGYNITPWVNNDNMIYGGNVTKVILSGEITHIGDYSFMYMSNLKEVDFDDNEGLTSIGSSVFFYDNQLESITIPATVTSIGMTCISQCDNLKSIIFEQADPSKIALGTQFLFLQAENQFETFYIPGKCTAAQVEAYKAKMEACYQYLPDWQQKPVIEIRQDPVPGIWNICKLIGPHEHEWKYKLDKNTPNQFKAYCSALDPENPDNKCDYYWDGKTGAGPAKWAVVTLEAKDAYACDLNQEHPYAPVLTDTDGIVAAPVYTYKTSTGAAVIGVPSEAGDYKVSLTVGEGKNAVTISDTFTLKDAVDHGKCGYENIEDSTWEVVKNDDFAESGGYTLLIHLVNKDTYFKFIKDYNDGSAPWYTSTKYDKAKITNIVIDKDIERIGDYNFTDLKGLKSVSFESGSSLWQINTHAFEKDTNLEFVVPKTVLEIQAYAFCESGKVTFERGSECRSIGTRCFYNNKKITEITLPESVTSIDEEAFALTNLTKIVFKNKNLDEISLGNNFIDVDVNYSEGISIIIPTECSDEQAEAFKNEVSGKLLGIQDYRGYEVKLDNEPAEKTVNIGREFANPVPLKEFWMAPPTDGDGNPVPYYIGDDFEEYVKGIEVRANLFDGTKNVDISEFCSFDFSDVNLEQVGSYKISAFISRTDSTGDTVSGSIWNVIEVKDKDDAKNKRYISYVTGMALYGTAPETVYADADGKAKVSDNTGYLALDGREFEKWLDIDSPEDAPVYYTKDQEVDLNALGRNLVLSPVFTQAYYPVEFVNPAGDDFIVKIEKEAGGYDAGHDNELKYGELCKVTVTVKADATEDFAKISGPEGFEFKPKEGDPFVDGDGNKTYTFTFFMPGYKLTAFIAPKRVITLYANVEGGKFASKAAAPEAEQKWLKIDMAQSLAIGDYLKNAEIPVAPEGYEFLGWFRDPLYEDEVYFNDIYEEDINLFAGWAFKGTRDASRLMVIKAIPDQIFTGSQIKPWIYIKDRGEELVEGTDYTVTYKNNINANKGGIRVTTNNLIVNTEGGKIDDAPFNAALPYVIIKGKGNYKGEIHMNFNINPKNITESGVDEEDDFDSEINAYYSSALVVNLKKKQKAENSLSYASKDAVKPVTLKLNKDYTINYYKEMDNNHYYPLTEIPAGASGNFEIEFAGIGNYKGSVFKPLMVGSGEKYLGDAKVTVKSATLIKRWDPDKGENGEWVNDVNVEFKSVKIGATEVAAADYTYNFVDCVDGLPGCPGTYDLRIEPAAEVVGGYFGRKDVKVNVKGSANTKALVFDVAQNHDYNDIEDEFVKEIKDPNYKDAGSNEYVLTEGTDYAVEIISKGNNTNAGTVKINIKGLGVYTGFKKSFTVKINPFDIAKNEGESFLVYLTNQASLYNPKGATADIRIWFKDTKLTEGVDYTVAYKNNKAVVSKNPPVITIKGKGNFKGSITLADSFKIMAKPISDAYVRVDAPDLIYKAGKPVSVKFTVVDIVSNSKLGAGKDYDKQIVSYRVNDGEETDKVPVFGTDCMIGDVIYVTIRGINNYTGKNTFEVNVKGNKIGSAKLAEKIEDKSYTGEAIKLGFMELELTYKIASEDEAAYFNANGGRRIVDRNFTTNLKKGDNIYLIRGKDFDMDHAVYDKNIAAGTASVTYRGLGFFGDSAKQNFKIVPKVIQWFK